MFEFANWKICMRPKSTQWNCLRLRRRRSRRPIKIQSLSLKWKRSTRWNKAEWFIQTVILRFSIRIILIIRSMEMVWFWNFVLKTNGCVARIEKSRIKMWINYSLINRHRQAIISFHFVPILLLVQLNFIIDNIKLALNNSNNDNCNLYHHHLASLFLSTISSHCSQFPIQFPFHIFRLQTNYFAFARKLPISSITLRCSRLSLMVD